MDNSVNLSSTISDSHPDATSKEKSAPRSEPDMPILENHISSSTTPETPSNLSASIPQSPSSKLPLRSSLKPTTNQSLKTDTLSINTRNTSALSEDLATIPFDVGANNSQTTTTATTGTSYFDGEDEFFIPHSTGPPKLARQRLPPKV